MIDINLSQLVTFHEKINAVTGGADGIRDKALLDSALNRPFVTFDGEELYDSTERKIAVLTHGLISNHGFIDGNKRIGVSVMLLMSRLNGIDLKYSQDELIEFGLSVAEGSLKEAEIYDWIVNHRI